MLVHSLVNVFQKCTNNEKSVIINSPSKHVMLFSCRAQKEIFSRISELLSAIQGTRDCQASKCTKSNIELFLQS